MAPTSSRQSGADDAVAQREQMAAARVFVEAFATVETYGGGRRAKLWLAGEFLDATDTWQGEEHALDRLAEVLLRRIFHVEWPLPCTFEDLRRAVEPVRLSSGQVLTLETLSREHDVLAVQDCGDGDHVRVFDQCGEPIGTMTAAGGIEP